MSRNEEIDWDPVDGMKSVGFGVRKKFWKHEIRRAEILLAGKVKGGEEMRPLCEV